MHLLRHKKGRASPASHAPLTRWSEVDASPHLQLLPARRATCCAEAPLSRVKSQLVPFLQQNKKRFKTIG